MTALSVKKTACAAAFTVLALALSYFEGFIPLSYIIPFPGIKLGLANIAVMAACFYLGIGYAIGVSLCRIFIGFLLFGSVTSLWFSFCGGIFALVGLWLYTAFLKNTNGIIGSSVLCAALHSTGQCLACSAIYGYYVMLTYLPYLLLFSVATGTVIGFIVWRLISLKIYQG